MVEFFSWMAIKDSYKDSTLLGLFQKPALLRK